MHLDSNESSSIKEWNEDWELVRKEAEAKVKDLDHILTCKMEQVSLSNDKISSIFAELYSNAHLHDSSVLSKA